MGAADREFFIKAKVSLLRFVTVGWWYTDDRPVDEWARCCFPLAVRCVSKIGCFKFGITLHNHVTMLKRIFLTFLFILSTTE